MSKETIRLLVNILIAGLIMTFILGPVTDRVAKAVADALSPGV